MKKILEKIANFKIVRRIFFKLFCHRLKTFHANYHFTDREKAIMFDKEDYKKHIKQSLAISILEGLVDEGYIEVEENSEGQFFRAKLYAYKR